MIDRNSLYEDVATSYIYDRDHDQFLLLFHRKLGAWLPPGGHLEPGEAPIDAAYRELKEEVGMEGQVWSPGLLGPRLGQEFSIVVEYIPSKPGRPPHLHIDHIFIILSSKEMELRLNDIEAQDIQWVATRDLPAIETFHNVRHMCATIASMNEHSLLI